MQAEGLCNVQKTLARQILWAVVIRARTHARALSAIRMSWALQLAMQQFQSPDPELQQAEALITSFYGGMSPFDALWRPGSFSTPGDLCQVPSGG